MLTRRETLIGGALTLVWGTDPGRAKDRRGRHGFGCVLEEDEAELFLATATAHQAFQTGDEDIIASTGNREFDYALAQTLSRLTDLFGVLPGFAYYDDYDGENAYATEARRMARVDGTVLYGKRYFLTGMSQAEHPDVVITATCAHEFGHIAQFKHRLIGRLNAGQQTVKRSELHADFLAGYFCRLAQAAKTRLPGCGVRDRRFLERRR
jgi:hypothetical protein